jgi:hypothetical protein
MDTDIVSEKKTKIYGKYYNEIAREPVDLTALFPSVYPLDSRLISQEDN